ncbi:MAG: NAD(P)-dependent alcohol dehydrogenase [Micrococcales bacterium]|nr:NAD(P)-dependent alcohol dehydrogenase [Micrococcales bacterium]MCL2667345.1 NAD(P)-dependent alcohol dehydrogenase [Micrococcales bacterium]
MKAVTYDRYGGTDRLTLSQIDPPVPGSAEVLVKVHAAGLNSYDWRMLKASPALVRAKQGWFRPKNRVLGADVAGVVADVGPNVTSLRPGDEVFACLEGCGAGGLAAGGLAELVAARHDVFVPVPAGLSFEQAAALPMAGVTALIAVRDVAKVAPGMDVLVNGAAGGVGTFAVQIAKAFGAQVTGVCATNHVEQTTRIGADLVVDYTTEDFVAQGERYDAVIDVAASRSVRDLRRVVRPGGVIAWVGAAGMRQIIGFSVAAARKKAPRRVVLVVADNTDPQHLRTLGTMVESGQIVPVMDRSYPMAQVADAFDYLSQGHAAGKITVRVHD